MTDGQVEREMRGRLQAAGMSPQEIDCLNTVTAAWNKIAELPPVHPDDTKRACRYINNLQQLLLARPLLRIAYLGQPTPHVSMSDDPYASAEASEPEQVLELAQVADPVLDEGRFIATIRDFLDREAAESTDGRYEHFMIAVYAMREIVRKYYDLDNSEPYKLHS